MNTKKSLSDQGCEVRLVQFKSPEDIVFALRMSRVSAVVRGTLGSAATMRELRLAFGLQVVMRTAVMEDSRGKCFLLTPVGIDEGCSVDARLALVTNTMAYFSDFRWKPKVGVLSKGRIEDVGRGEDIRRSVEEGELLAKKLRSMKYDARHFAILIEDAVKRSDLIVAPDGVTGNLIFCSLYFVGEGKAFGAPVVNLDKVFVDTSRAKLDFADSVMLAAGLAEAKATRAARA